MKVRILLVVISFLTVVSSTRLHAIEDGQLSAIQELGHLYGIALPCNYIQETRRIKKALVSALPKKRYLGQIFEEATNESFLKFVNDGTACPNENMFANDVDAGIESLNRAF